MRTIAAVALSTILAGPAAAQSFNQFLGFGDSSIDSGYFKYTNRENGTEPRYVTARANGGSITPSAGLMNSQYLASAFGLTAIPVSAPGGGSNYAVSGARIDQPNLGGGSSPSIVQQINTYLAANGGRANPDALYLISGGANDLAAFTALSGPAFTAAITPIAADFVQTITRLSQAGARYIVVPNYAGSAVRATNLSQGIWNALSNNGVNFIPADANAMRLAILADPARFGFTSVTPQVLGSAVQTASCHTPNGFNNANTAGYGLYCIPSTTPAGAGANATAYLNSANSLQTSLYSDDQHFSPAGQKIQADYVYSLIVAPSQISFLAENAIQVRRGITLGIEQQLDITLRRQTPGFNIWFNGDLSSLKLDNYPGFPGDPSTPIAGTLGASYSFNGNSLVGAAVTLGSQDPSFASGGGFKQQEVAATLFGAARNGPFWGNAILSYGWLHYDVNRIVPLGISFDSNSAKTRGSDISFAGLAGYDFHHGAVTHGPVAGVEVQTVSIGSFTETGSFTSLAFSGIGRTSVVSALGYRAAIDYGIWRPFAQATWNHEFDNTADRTVTATLTSVTAPSYRLPIVQLGKDWASAAIGTTVTVGRDWTGLAALNAQLGQDGTVNYGGRLGLNYAFYAAAPARLITK
jgi:outer membrane lipase/esterase